MEVGPIELFLPPNPKFLILILLSQVMIAGGFKSLMLFSSVAITTCKHYEQTCPPLIMPLSFHLATSVFDILIALEEVDSLAPFILSLSFVSYDHTSYFAFLTFSLSTVSIPNPEIDALLHLFADKQ